MRHVTPTISTETALRLVADPRCRAVLQQLIDRERTAVSLDVLVEHVAPENPPPEGKRAEGSERLFLELQHHQLPKLEDAGLLEYDDRSGTIRYRPNDRVEKVHRFVTAELE